MSKRGHGQVCTYCERALESVSSQSRVAATKDHVVPKSKGGHLAVWACRQCNAIKKDMSPDDWTAFMESYPEWWTNPLFHHMGRGNTHKQRTFYAYQNGLRPKTDMQQRQESGSALAIIPYTDSMYILKHGKKAWRAKKAMETSGLTIPAVEFIAASVEAMTAESAAHNQAQREET